MEQEQFSKLQRSALFRFFDRLSHLVIVNFIMILFSIFGLVIFGVYPAIFAAAAIFNEALEQKEGNLLRKFWGFYKKYFVIGNFLMLLTCAVILSGYWLVFKMSTEISIVISAFIYFAFLIIAIAVLIWNLYLPSVIVLYPGFSFKKGMLFSIVAAFSKWKLTLKLLLLYCSWIFVILLFPQIMMFIFLSSFCWFSIWIVKYNLRKDTIPEEAE